MLIQDKEDMKVIKFKQIARELHDYLNYFGAFSDEEHYLEQNTFGFPLKGWLGEKTAPVKYIYKPPFLEKAVQDNKYLSVLNNIIVTCSEKAVLIDRKPQRISNMEDVINAFSSCQTMSVYRDNNPNFEIAEYYELIFWLLFIVAIDDDIYDSNLSDIIDLAYCLKFNEEMINDWCRAIEYVLSGNQLCEEGCDLELDTKEGRWFFLHDQAAFWN